MTWTALAFRDANALAAKVAAKKAAVDKKAELEKLAADRAAASGAKKPAAATAAADGDGTAHAPRTHSDRLEPTRTRFAWFVEALSIGRVGFHAGVSDGLSVSATEEALHRAQLSCGSNATVTGYVSLCLRTVVAKLLTNQFNIYKLLIGAI